MMKRKIHFLISSILFFLLFVGFTLVVKYDQPKQLDFNILVKLQDNMPVRLDGVLSLFSLLASFEVVAVVLALYLLIRRRVKGVFVFVSFIGAHVVEYVGKLLFDHPGPPYLFHRQAVGLGFPTSYVESQGSYPSGHALRAVFISTVFIYAIWRSKKFNQNWKILLSAGLVVFTLLVVLGKLALGQHWMTDVIAGVFLGLSVSLFALLFI